jgi:hypothetical protein
MKGHALQSPAGGNNISGLNLRSCEVALRLCIQEKITFELKQLA